MNLAVSWLKAVFPAIVAVLCLTLAATPHAVLAASAGDDPPRSLAVDTGAAPAAWLPQVLPTGARLIHGPVKLAFGAHASGQLLAWRTAQGGYAVVYLTPEFAPPGQPGRQRWLWLREPKPADDYIDVELRAAFAQGPPLSRDIVLLETYSRAAPAGGAREQSGSVYRRIGPGAEAVPELAALLQDVADTTTARARLAPAYSQLLPSVPGRLAALFASLPVKFVDLTALERLQRLRADHPAYGRYDAGNGYLQIRGDAGLPGYVSTLFKHTDGGWLLALQQRVLDRQRTWFLRPVAGDWVDVSAAVMPAYDPALNYRLPQHGRFVQGPAAAGPGGWQWTGQRFEPSTQKR